MPKVNLHVIGLLLVLNRSVYTVIEVSQEKNYGKSKNYIRVEVGSGALGSFGSLVAGTSVAPIPT